MRAKQLAITYGSSLGLLLTWACSGADALNGITPDAGITDGRLPGTPATVTVSPSTATIVAGQAVQATATAYDGRGRVISGVTFTWSSSDTTRARVSATGLVSGVAAGSVLVSARSGTASASSSVIVTAPVATPAPSSSGRWVAGYWVGYGRSQYPETDIDFSSMTHVIVGAIQPTSTGGVTTTFYLDATTGPVVARTISSRAHQAGRKAILMLGGAGSLGALRTATSDAYRATFVANLVHTMDDLGYDGIDVDWEPLASTDAPQVLQFLRDLRTARPSILLSLPTGWVGASSAPPSWLTDIAAAVDQVNVMSYSMADAWPGWTSWHEGALAGESASHPSSISSTVRVLLAAGVPAARIGVGVGAYGSCWRGPTAPDQATGSGVVASDNVMSYSAIMSQYYSAGAYRWDATAHEGYLSFAAPTGAAGCTMISYEDPQAVLDRAAYVKTAGLGGLIVWTINQGHLASAAAGQQDPLLAAAYTAVLP